MTITSSFICLLILLLFCLSFGYSLQGNNNEKPSVNVVSNAKVMKHVDHDDNAMKKEQVRGRNGDEFSKETTKMTMNSKKKPTKKETSVEEENDLVACTADYWKPRHHPPKNN